MKLVTFTHAGRTRIGIVLGAEVCDVAARGAVPADMIALLAGGADWLEAARAAVGSAPRLALGEVHLEAPVPRPPKYLAIGLNYADHAAETGRPAPDFPIFFNKQTSCVSGPYD